MRPLFCLLLGSISLFGNLEIQYKRLDVNSVEELLAFYTLYPETPKGKESLERAWKLLGGEGHAPLSLDLNIDALVHTLANPNSHAFPLLNAAQIQQIDTLRSHLPLYRNGAPPFDLTHELLKSFEACACIASDQRKSLERVIDLIALIVHSKLSSNPSPRETIETLNTFIFETMYFRFPPKSESEKETEAYTSLPTILSSRRGICLGVSTLYLCLAQKLNLNLVPITPPGHIFLRHEESGRNIETTARGIHLPDERYLNLQYKKLKSRSIQDVIGMNYFNFASYWLRKKKYKKMLEMYENAGQTLKNDPLLMEFTGYAHILLGEHLKGKQWLRRSLKAGKPSSPLLEDILKERADRKALEQIFADQGETYMEILSYQKKLQKTLQAFPTFQQGWLMLGISYLQLERLDEGIEALEQFHQLNPDYLLVEYYLSALHLERWDLPQAWRHFAQLENLLDGNVPPIIQALKTALLNQAPTLQSKTP